MNKILVTGATGSLGSQVVDFLLEKVSKESIVAMARDLTKAKDLESKGVEVRKGDYDDPDSLVRAFQGIDKLYFVSGSDIEKRIKQHESVVNAAKEAGVKHIFYTSFQRKNETDSSPIAPVAEGHLKAEKWIKESGITYTLLKHNLYMDLIPMFVGENVLKQGIYLPAREGKTAFVLRKDMARAAASILTSEGHENKVYDITSDQAYSFEDIAKMISEVSGKEVAYTSPSQEEFISTLKNAGVPEDAIGISTLFGEGIAQGEFEKTSDDVEKLTGEKPTPLKDFLKSVYGG